MVSVTRWTEAEPPDEASILNLMQSEGLRPYHWSNGPGDVYAAHRHSYDKVIYVVRGSIAFGLPDTGEEIYLQAGDRLDLPQGVTHNAHVGSQGVACLEAHR
jgi:quercetin dioxygenase-like cupin family protein